MGGAASSFPALLTEEHAKVMVGDAWPTVSAKWPAGAESVTREQLEEMVAAHPDLMSVGIKWDEVPVGSSTRSVVIEAPKEEELALKREKVLAMKREKAESFRRRESGKAKRPPRAAETAERRSQRQQSEQLRALLKAQRKAARDEGRPPSRGGLEDVECQLYVKPKDEDAQIFDLRESSPPDICVIGDDDDDVSPAPAAAPLDSRPESAATAATVETAPAAELEVALNVIEPELSLKKMAASSSSPTTVLAL